MKYYSLNGNTPHVDFALAAVQGQAPDKGLYFPESIPLIDPELIKNIDKYSNAEIAYQIIRPYIGGMISDERLKQIAKETVDFKIPLVDINEKISALELFHGPTLAFKDVGARFMSRCLAELKKTDKQITVLVATSGDTGGAVANGFYNVPGIKVVILYPSKKVSPVQEMQLTALGKNIQALEVNGNFDDCQAMVKQAFMDTEIHEAVFLTSANSINIARWLPQQFYYAFAYKQWKDKAHPPVICVPSGNFGNLCAGVIAHCSGLPVHHFIAACNVNDSVAQYFTTGIFNAKETIATYSNAMDVGNPSNFPRLVEMMKDHSVSISADTITDEETVSTIQKVYQQYNYLLDPHGAVAYAALEKYLEKNPGQKGFILETAHPVKFPDVIESSLSLKIPVPASLENLLRQQKQSILINPSFEELKKFLLNK